MELFSVKRVMYEKEEVMNFTEIYYEKVPKRLKELRKGRGRSQIDLAKMFGVGQRTVSDYERGVVIVPYDRFLTLAKYYDVSLEYLTGLSDQPGKFPC